MKHYELKLLENYKLAKVIDGKNTKIALIMNLVAIPIMIALLVIGCFIYYNVHGDFKFIVDTSNIFAVIIYFVGFIIAIIIHELIHGLFFKIFTKQKLTFGISWSAAYCGVPNVYVKRKAMMITCMAPCLILSIVLLIPLFLITDIIYFVFVLLIFASHFAGCCGDIYVFILLLFKYRDNETLIQDTGLKQTFYVKK